MTIPNRHSTDTDWLGFYSYLRRVFSKKEANEWFIRFWGQNAGEQANTSTLRSEMRDKGVEIEAGTIAGQIGDSIGSIGDSVGKIFKTALIVAIVGAGIYLYVQANMLSKKGK